MKAVVWHGTEDVRVDEVPDPKIVDPTDAIVRITSTAICGSDLHLYKVLGMYMDEGDILGHEPMGIVEEVGPAVTHVKAGDRVVMPFNISCGHCFMCDQELYSQCETTQVKEYEKGAALLGFSKMYGRCPAGRRSSCAFRRPSSARSRCPRAPHTSVSSTSPTCSRPRGRRSSTPTCRRAGRSPSTDSGRSASSACRIAKQLGVERVIAVDLVPERNELARKHGAEIIEWKDDGSSVDVIRELTNGRGADAVTAAVPQALATPPYLAATCLPLPALAPIGTDQE